MFRGVGLLVEISVRSGRLEHEVYGMEMVITMETGRYKGSRNFCTITWVTRLWTSVFNRE